MGFLDFFSRRRPALEPTLLTTERLEAAIEAVVDRVNPKLRLASDYQARLGPAIERFLVAAREDVSRIPAPHLATPDAWVSDPDLHAFFATAQDLVALVSRARQVKELFRAQPGADTAYGLLGMSVESRQVFGTELQGDMVRQDVPQETLSFGDHRINLVAADEAALRQTLVRALGEQVLIEALAEMDLAKARLKRGASSPPSCACCRAGPGCSAPSARRGNRPKRSQRRRRLSRRRTPWCARRAVARVRSTPSSTRSRS
jgi:hypothetical protein